MAKRKTRKVRDKDPQAKRRMPAAEAAAEAKRAKVITRKSAKRCDQPEANYFVCLVVSALADVEESEEYVVRYVLKTLDAVFPAGRFQVTRKICD